jgi:hypothetical protein
MGKWLVLVLLLSAGTLSPRTAPITRAQTLPCSGTPSTLPMQGHYTGPWHSDADYHFAVFNTDLLLHVTIDGTLDVTVAPDGSVTGTASGKVDAPIYDYGTKDVSSGYGTISGPVTGSIATGLVVNAPVIDMQWGTFVGGGYTVERFITMPNYTLSVGSNDCVSAGGTISETNFPTMNVVDDGGGQMTQAPGIGQAGGTWQLTSDAAATFTSLSKQVDAFISSANAVLAGSELSAVTVRQQIVEPLQTLQRAIASHPDVARCLEERLGAWEASAVPALYARIPLTDTSAAGLRASAGLLREGAALGADCDIPDSGASDRLLTSARSALDASIAAADWAQAALVAREIVLWQGDSIRPSLQTEINADLHARLTTFPDSGNALTVARAAYALGDQGDMTSAYKRLTAHVPSGGKKTKKKKTLGQVLTGGIARIKGTATGNQPSFSWQPVPAATRYVLAVTDSGHTLVWTWSGSSTSVAYGDTAIEGVAGTAAEVWPVAYPQGAVWTVLALNSAGQVVGIKTR